MALNITPELKKEIYHVRKAGERKMVADAVFRALLDADVEGEELDRAQDTLEALKSEHNAMRLVREIAADCGAKSEAEYIEIYQMIYGLPERDQSEIKIIGDSNGAAL